jgi:competence protein ComEC
MQFTENAHRYITQKIHYAWIITWLAVGVLCGVVIAHVGNIGFSPPQLVIIALSTGVLAFLKRRRYMVLVALFAGCLIGIARGQYILEQTGIYEVYYGKNVKVSGRIVSDPAFSKSGDQRLELSGVMVNANRLHGHIWVSTGAHIDLKRGDTVSLAGKLEHGFGSVTASMYRARVIDASRPQHGDVARELRDWFAEKVRAVVPEPQASLGIGFLVGQRSVLPGSLDEKLRLIGLTHIVVASGYNLTILVRLARRSLAKTSKYLATFAALSMVAGFVLITGFSPSMTRAAIVTILSLWAWYYGRNIHPLVLLPVTAAITALINPYYVWGDIGWYLSFTAFAGIMIVAPLLKSYFWDKDAKLGTFTQICVETVSAQLVTLPIIAFVFGQYSPLALIANILVAPIIPIAMVLTFIAGLAEAIIPTFTIGGAPAQFVLSYLTSIVNWLGRLPWASRPLSFTVIGLIASYVALLLVCIYMRYKTGHTFRKNNIIE